MRPFVVVLFVAAGCIESPPHAGPGQPVAHPASQGTTSTSPPHPTAEPPYRVVDRPPYDAAPDNADDAESEFPGIWPHVRPADLAAEPKRWSDPAVVAREFLREYAGVPDPRAGPFRAGEPAAGEVEVRRGARGPVTTVVVRQLGEQGRDAPWTVTAAIANALRVSSPSPLAVLKSPVTVNGESTAFEAIADVDIRENGQTWGTRLGHSILTGGANGEFAPFEARVTFSRPARPAGALVFYTLSAEDGLPMEATVVKIRFR